MERVMSDPSMQRVRILAKGCICALTDGRESISSTLVDEYVSELLLLSMKRSGERGNSEMCNAKATLASQFRCDATVASQEQVYEGGRMSR